MTQVHSSGGAMAPFATSVSKGKAKAAAQPDKKVPAPKATEAKAVAVATGGSQGRNGTEVSFGKQALHAIEGTAEFAGKAVLTGRIRITRSHIEEVKTAVSAAAFAGDQ